MTDSDWEASARHSISALTRENADLREALLDATAHLAGAVSAYENFAGNSKRPGVRDALFNTRLQDFKKALKRARLALHPQPNRDEHA